MIPEYSTVQGFGSRIPATIFATKKWLDRNSFGVSVVKARRDLALVARGCL